jgi:hypothetical protein
MVRNFAVQSEAAKAEVSEVEMNVLAQAALPPNALAIAPQQHAAHPSGSIEGRLALP